MHLSKIILALFISISAPLTWASVPESKVSLAKELLRVNGEAELMEVMISEGFQAGCQPMAGQRQLTLGDWADLKVDPRSAIITVGALVLPEVVVGIMDASITRRPATPWTLNWSSTTARLS